MGDTPFWTGKKNKIFKSKTPEVVLIQVINLSYISKRDAGGQILDKGIIESENIQKW